MTNKGIEGEQRFEGNESEAERKETLSPRQAIIVDRKFAVKFSRERSVRSRSPHDRIKIIAVKGLFVDIAGTEDLSRDVYIGDYGDNIQYKLIVPAKGKKMPTVYVDKYTIKMDRTVTNELRTVEVVISPAPRPDLVVRVEGVTSTEIGKALALVNSANFNPQPVTPLPQNS